MSTLAPPDPTPPADPEVDETTAGAAEDAAPGAPTDEGNGDGEDTPEPLRASVLQTAAAATLATAGAGWMIAGLFDSGLARALAVLAPLLGGSLVYLSHRFGRPGVGQYLTVPFALLVAGLVVLPDTPGGSANVVSLVREALFSGGLGDPPVPFDPGWRFLLVALLVVLGAGSAGLAIGTDRPKLALGVPLPLVVLAGLVQPPGAEVTSTVGALALVGAALVIEHGNELARSGAASGRFEARRILRGAVSVVGLALALIVVANLAGFLLPPAQEDQVVPPQRPPVAPPQEDRPLFAVEAADPSPWRLGALDVYQDGAWMLPPFDPARLVELAGAGELPGAPTGGPTADVVFTVVDLGGRGLPTPPGARAVTSDGAPLEFDPRTRTLRAPERATPGLTYRVQTAPRPDTEALRSSIGGGGLEDDFTAAPPIPPEVAELLARAPAEPLFDRLQFVRQAYYDQVVAAGAGDPVDTPPERVVEILSGSEATPYEIAAGEALLARWAGVPARLGFGYYGGAVEEERAGETVRPRDGASWLEVHVEGYGWAPILGTPPRAQSSLSEGPRNEDPSVRPTDELALITFIPVQQTGPQLAFEVVRYWALRAVPLVVLAIGAIALYPALLRVLRRARRRRWAARRGPVQRVAAAYAELRDWAWDANLAAPSLTPLEFAARVEHDGEHRELAWLVSRALWGDLGRDLREQDAELAEEMAASVLQRLRAAQPGLARVLAAASRASLRDPYSDDLPNLWPKRSLRERRRGLWRAVVRWVRRRRRRPRLATTALWIVTVSLLLSGCTDRLDLDTELTALPFGEEPLVPERLGDVRFVREPGAEEPFADAGPDALVADGRVYSVHRDDAIEASLQLAAFKPGALQRRDDLVAEVLASLGGRAEPTRFGPRQGYVFERTEQRLLVWFAPDLSYYQLLAARASFEQAHEVFSSVLAFQHGEPVEGLDAPGTQRRHDPRRGTLG